MDAGLAGVFGLLVGSFLNVVIYRLPRMMYREWLDESLQNLQDAPPVPSLWKLVFGPGQDTPRELEAAATAGGKQLQALPPFTIIGPASRCPRCGTPIRWYQNVPVVSYLVLRGKCAACGNPISPRYPIVELVTGGLFAFCVWKFGVSLQAALWMAFCALLLCQFLIDLDTQLLPDTLTYLLLWLGLGGAALKLTGIPLAEAVWGAILGYGVLWVIFQAYKLATGRIGMGHGDFKLLAALGAWLGASYLLPIVLLSSVVGAVLGIALIAIGRIANRHIPISFGPFLAATGILVLVLGPQAMRDYFPFAFALDRL
ncbi:prepilin peptidase [Ramlibacter sp. PS4R-6]|uniref:prepilin peptidase n=1 Tax=Ramlibacter sp. PS4R-6 TaxID=3133438 RepID=UPI0030993540